ncbi:MULTISPECIES: YciI-like protein [unclassified Novosphingobium]|uniref:YciI-like protein n=1 Tax=unclassified Novosphingobium TaxID=2644732 RepID=UPI00135B485F|nr:MULTISPECIES: YciI-like protein [unclassified Novosphingobium]
MNHYLLTYTLSADYLERRPQFRSAHLALAWAAADRGELVLAGAIEDPVDIAQLLFAGEGPDTAEAFARADPYVTNGLVERWSVRRWNTVVGAGAANPVRS